MLRRVVWLPCCPLAAAVFLCLSPLCAPSRHTRQHVDTVRRTGQALVGERISAAQATRKPFYSESDDRGPPEYEREVEEEHERMRERAARSGETPWHSGGIYDEDCALVVPLPATAATTAASADWAATCSSCRSHCTGAVPARSLAEHAARQPMERQPEPAPSWSGGAPASPIKRAPWEARDGEVYVERGKAPPKARKHRAPSGASRLLANDHLEAEQVRENVFVAMPCYT
jgi:hypothetical protein